MSDDGALRPAMGRRARADRQVGRRIAAIHAVEAGLLDLVRLHVLAMSPPPPRGHPVAIAGPVAAMPARHHDPIIERPGCFA